MRTVWRDSLKQKTAVLLVLLGEKTMEKQQSVFYDDKSQRMADEMAKRVISRTAEQKSKSAIARKEWSGVRLGLRSEQTNF